MIRIYPAIMGIDADQIHKLELLTDSTDCVHIDIMDKVFVPNVTQGTELIDDFAKKADLYIWTHLMIQHPLYFLNKYTFPENSLLSFHLESGDNIFDTIKIIKEKKCIPSIAINPRTPVEEVMPFLSDLGQVLIMSVNPGFSGQSFLPEVISKIHYLVHYRRSTKSHFRIGIDGGINKTNIKQLVQEGIDECAVSSALFESNNPAEALRELYKIIEK